VGHITRIRESTHNSLGLLEHAKNTRKGFTIVELLIVVVVIAILAAITIVAYNGISSRAKTSSAQSSAETASKKVQAYMTTNSDQVPVDLTTAGVTDSSSTTYQYSKDTSVTPQTFCITVTVSNSVSYYIDNTLHTMPVIGACPGHVAAGPPPAIANGSIIQTVTSANCPGTRTRTVDARDTHTYWVQKLADGKCWMLTNLAYAGGGTNTYSDTKTLSNGTGDSTTTYTIAKYYIPSSGSNVTTEPTAPSTSTNGAGQYGYMYNWCAAMGNQQSTDACSGTDTTDVNPLVSICPAGWRLPTGGKYAGTMEFSALTTALGATNDTAGATIMQSNWLAQLADGWWGSSGFGTPGYMALYWSSTQQSNFYAYNLGVRTNMVNPDNTGEIFNKYYGFSVRCIAN